MVLSVGPFILSGYLLRKRGVMVVPLSQIKEGRLREVKGFTLYYTAVS